MSNVVVIAMPEEGYVGTRMSVNGMEIHGLVEVDMPKIKSNEPMAMTITFLVSSFQVGRIDQPAPESRNHSSAEVEPLPSGSMKPKSRQVRRAEARKAADAPVPAPAKEEA